MGALVNGDPMPDVQMRIPLGDDEPARPRRRRHRHGQDAHAAGARRAARRQGRRRCSPPTSRATSPASRRRARRTRSCWRAPTAIGQDVEPAASVHASTSRSAASARACPIRATVAGFGPLLLSKVLGLNDTQESSLGLVFHYADDARARAASTSPTCGPCCSYLTSDEGKAELEDLGGLSAATAGVILRELDHVRRRRRRRLLRRARVRHGRVPARRHPTAAASSACSRCRASPTSRRCSRRS